MCRYFCIEFIDFMLKGKSLTDFTNLYPNLGDQREFTLNTINEIKDYFIADIRERELMSKRLSKYIVSFDYFNKFIIALSATSGGVFIA